MWNRLVDSMRWTRSSSYILGAFFLVIGLIIYVWWPLAEAYLALYNWEIAWWKQIDYLLLGIFAFMSLMIMAGADIRSDLLIVFVGMVGGLVIEAWGTQTELWVYYTNERPPLWIIPAWPIASLTINRMVRLLQVALPERFGAKELLPFYIALMGGFMALLLVFVWPTIDKSLTIAAIAICILMIIAPRDLRMMLLTFIAGTALGYFLERWGTTRLCWIYYTHEQPPVFAVLAHGMAAVAFWRTELLIKDLAARWWPRSSASLPAATD